MEATRHIIAEIPEIVLDFPGRRPAQKTVVGKRFKFRTFIIILLVLSTAGVARVCQNALIAQNGIDISRLEEEIMEEQRIGKGLKVERMLLQSPSRLERLATRRLDMVKPQNINYIVVPAGPQKKTAERLTRASGLLKIAKKANLLVR